MTYADNYDIRNKDLVSLNKIANAIDGLLTSYTLGTSSTDISTTSTSSTDSDLSISLTAASGQKVITIAHMALGHASAADIFMAIDVTQNTVSSGMARSGTPPVSDSTTGNRIVIEHIAIWTPSVGANTYKLRWQVASGTAWSTERSLLAFTVRTS